MKVGTTAPKGATTEELVDHPAHYGGADNPYEVFKVVEAWGLDQDAYLFTAVKYLARQGKKEGEPVERDLRKAIKYIEQRLSTSAPNLNPLIKLYGDGIGKVELVDHMGDDKRIVNAARVSFGKDADEPFDEEKDTKLLQYLLSNRHTSPFEHCAITWKFTVPLFVRSQHHRHRTWAYNEISRRYTSDNPQFFCPRTFRTQHEKNRQASNNDAFNPHTSSGDPNFAGHPVSDVVTAHVSASLAVYEEMLRVGVAREQARMVLPQNLYTEYYGTVSLHNAFGFLRLRLDDHAQWEIRVVAEAMLMHLESLFPVATAAFKQTLGA